MPKRCNIHPILLLNRNALFARSTINPLQRPPLPKSKSMSRNRSQRQRSPPSRQPANLQVSKSEKSPIAHPKNTGMLQSRLHFLRMDAIGVIYFQRKRNPLNRRLLVLPRPMRSRRSLHQFSLAFSVELARLLVNDLPRTAPTSRASEPCFINFYFFFGLAAAEYQGLTSSSSSSYDASVHQASFTCSFPLLISIIYSLTD